MPGKHLPADHSLGDVNTLGGYVAVHARPAAFEGADGFSYSVEIMADRMGEPARPWGAYLLFVQWGRIGATSPSGHVETDFLAEADTEADAHGIVSGLSLSQVRAVLHALIAGRLGSEPTRRWYDVMNEDSDSGSGA